MAKGRSMGWVGAGIVALLVLNVGVASAQPLTLNKCSAGKKKCVGAKAAALLKCHVKSETKGIPPDDKDCITKARAKYDGGADPSKGCFAKLEGKYPVGSATPCLTFGDSAALEAKVDAFVASAVSAVDPAYPALIVNKCSAGKKKCLSAELTGLLKCHQKAESKGVSPNEKGCIDKVEAKFDGGPDAAKGCFAKLEAKYGADSEVLCPTFGDEVAVDALVDAFVNDVVTDLDPGIPTTTTTVPPTTTTTTGPATTTTTIAATTTTTSTTSTTSTTIPTGATCGPNGIIATVSVPYDPFALPALASIRLDVTYPASVSIPGNGFETDDSRLTIVTGQSGSTIFVDRDDNADGIDDTFRIAYALTGGLTFPPGPLADVLLDCTNGTPINAAAFSCIVLDAANPVGTSIPNPHNIPCGVSSLRLP